MNDSQTEKLIAFTEVVASGIAMKTMSMDAASTLLLNTVICRYHKGEAVFHDGEKYWSCCPQTKVLDFDQFMEIPGCMVGKHDDGRE